MKLEEITQSRIGKITSSELFGLRLRAIQLYEKYLEVEKRESLINIDWDSFYKNYKLLTNEFDKRSLNFTRCSIDKVLEKAKYFGIKIIEKQNEDMLKTFSLLAQIGQSNILINPEVKKEQISEPINGVIITKTALDNLKNIDNYIQGVPIYAIGKVFDKIISKEKHLFIKSLKIGENQALIRPIKILYKKKSPNIGLLVSQKDIKLSILPEFLSLTKSAQELIKGTVWICEIKKYDKDDEQNEQICFLSLLKMAEELKPKKIFLINIGEDLLKYQEEVNQELKKWQGRILNDGDILEQDEIMRGIVWEINEAENHIESLDKIDSITKYMKDRAIAEVNFNGICARIEKKGKNVTIMINPDIMKGSPLKSKLLPLQVDEIGSFRDDFVGEGTIVAVDDEKNQCLGIDMVKNFLAQSTDITPNTFSNNVHIFISDLLNMNGKDIGEWTLEKRKKMMSYFGNREHVHFVKPVADLEKNSLSYVIDMHVKEEIQKAFNSIIKASNEGKFYPKDIAKGVIIKCLSCPYMTKRISISKPETTENYHRIPVTDCKITATMTLSATKGIKALYCGGSGQIATYLFDISKWTMAEAKAWVKDHMAKAEAFNCICTECDKEMKSAVDCKNVNCPDCGSVMETKGQPNPENTEKDLNKSDIKFDFKKVGKEPEYIVGGVAYFSNTVDSQGDFARQNAVWDAMKNYMVNKRNIKVMHKGDVRKVPIVESFFVEFPTFKGGTKEENKLNKGDFWISVYLGDKENRDIWEDAKSGKLTGFSIGGKANSVAGYV